MRIVEQVISATVFLLSLVYAEHVFGQTGANSACNAAHQEYND